MKTISYLFLRFIIILLGIMPFRLMYLFSDVVYFLVYHVIGYRRKVVSENLRSSFPEMNETAIRSLTEKFYHHLCDISLESIK